MSDYPLASSPSPAPAQTPQDNCETTPVHVKEESIEEEAPPSLPSPMVPKSEEPSSSPSRIRRTLAQRRAFLQDDPLVGEAECDKVYCRRCKKWIKLMASSEYNLTNWLAHKQRCIASRLQRTPSKRDFAPGSRVATAERRMALFNDLQVKDYSTKEVHCRSCKTTVLLEGEVDYDLTKWTEHKETCILKTAAPITPEGSKAHAYAHSTSSTRSQASTARSARSPTPAERDSSSQSTLVGDSSPDGVNPGVKRGRDDDDENTGDARPTRRARTEDGVMRWLMGPLTEFARGFREGLGMT